MLNICVFDLKQYIMDDRTIDKSKMNFFRKRELLFGNTLAEVFVKDPMAILGAL